MGPLLRLCAVTATGLVAISFLLFALDQSREGSENQVRAVERKGAHAPSQAAIDRASPPPTVERARESQHSSVREAIDDADDVLLSPFNDLVESKNVWVERLVPGTLAVLLYGLGGMLLANFLPKRPKQVRDWREATS